MPGNMVTIWNALARYIRGGLPGRSAKGGLPRWTLSHGVWFLYQASDLKEKGQALCPSGFLCWQNDSVGIYPCFPSTLVIQGQKAPVRKAFSFPAGIHVRDQAPVLSAVLRVWVRSLSCSSDMVNAVRT